MIKQLWKRTCAFDAEWVPCPDTARRLLGLPSWTPDKEAMEAVWQHYAKEEGERPFLKLALSRVVSIASVLRSVDKEGGISLHLRTSSVDQTPEGRMISTFLEGLAHDRRQLWGFNSSGADLPILVQRAIALGESCPHFCTRPNKPWEGPDYFDSRNSMAHMDMLQLLANYARGAAWPSLNEIAAASGIPGKLDTSGADVADLYLAGDIRTITDYNETDALTTHLLMLRMAHFSARLSDEQYAQEQAAVDALLEREIADGKGHLERFQEAWHGGRGDEDTQAGSEIPF